MKFLDKYNIKFKDDKNLNIALTHTSYSNEHKCPSYERLEFLGDAVLELITSEYFYKNYDYPEGQMTKIRSRYVCEHALYEYAKVVGFIPYIKVGNGQIHDVNETIIADVFEAILGAIFLEFGYETSRDYILKIITPFIENKVDFYSDYKSLLQELVQTDKRSLEYTLLKNRYQHMTKYMLSKFQSMESYMEPEQVKAKKKLNKKQHTMPTKKV